MTEKEAKKRSKLLSLALRHNPSALSIDLDESGWAPIDGVLCGLEKKRLPTSHAQLEIMVRENNKQRFRISDDGKMIRANQGHSITVELELESRKPPEILYHGTATRFEEAIRIEGIVRQNRQHVHLSAEEHTAQLVGARHGKPVILQVDTTGMLAAGHEFFISENGVWLTDHVPPQFILSAAAKSSPKPMRAIQGDITTLAVDAIVNAANSSLLGGGGVDGAIHRAAGKDLLHECRLLSGCKTGEAKITAGYNLPAKHIIHTVGPVWREEFNHEAKLLESCYRNALDLALQNGCRQIAFPCISTGVYSYPPDKAAQVAVETCRPFSAKIEIVFCCFDAESKQIYDDLLEIKP